jgi:hypothetical protein
VNPFEFLSYVKTIDRYKHIIAGRRGSEENIKTKIIIPLLQTLGWDLLNDMDFENKGCDIVLLKEGKPLIIVETKAWEQDITESLNQCLEYTFKFQTPWILISSGQETSLYCSLINPDDLNATEPLLNFSFTELISIKGNKILKELLFLIGKNNAINGAKELEKSASNRISEKTLDAEYKDFFAMAENFKPAIKSLRISEEDFLDLAKQHPPEICNALNYIYSEMTKFDELNGNIRIRNRSKEIGIEYVHRIKPRQKIRGLIGIYPEDAHISFSFKGWAYLKITQETFDKLKSFPRKASSIEFLKQAIEEIV